MALGTLEVSEEDMLEKSSPGDFNGSSPRGTGGKSTLAVYLMIQVERP